MQILDKARGSSLWPSVYYGERGDWLLAYASGEPTDCVTKANMRAFQRALPDGSFEVETFKGPLSGCSSEYLLIDPARQDAIDIAKDILRELEDYPVIDEEVLSEVEYDEALESAAAACDIAPGGYAERIAAADFILTVSEDNNRGVGYANEYWPTEDDVFFGYLHYRRYTRLARAYVEAYADMAQEGSA